MKKRTYITLFLWAAALLSGCTGDEEIVGGQSSLLTVAVTAAAFSSDEGMATRTTDIGYSTTFAAGDRIGIFAIADDGIILDNNIPYTYSGTQWNPVDTDNTIHHYNYAGVTYYAYYPYSASMDDASGEQAIIDKFTPKQDQSDKADYTASDLMTGTGEVADADTDSPKLTLTLKHKMSVIVVDIKSNSYVTTGGYEYFEPIACSSIDIGGTDILQNNLAFVSSVGVYRYIVPPGSTPYSVSVSYNAGEINKEYSYSTTVKQTSAGKYHLIKLHREEAATQRDLKVGDFYYQDGSILPGDSTFYNLASNPCIGIVFKVGAGKWDSDPNRYDGKLLAVHGYVLSLDQANKSWGDNSKSWNGTSWYEYQGYVYTKNLLAGMAEGKSFPACSWCVEHTPVPTGMTSGWHFPSLNPVLDFVDNAATLNTFLSRISGSTTISGTYISGTESGYNTTTHCNGRVTGNTGSVYRYAKTEAHLIRAMLTF